MKKRAYVILTAVAVACCFAALPLAPVSAQLFQNAKGAACGGVGLSGTGNCAANTAPVDNIIHTVVNLLSIAIGVTAVIMMMVGGFKYVTSQGDSSSIASARNTIMYALVGVVVAALAQVLVRFVLARAG